VLACGAFAFAAGAPAFVAIVLLVIALGALTSAELENSAGEWFLSVELAPARLRERYLSTFKTCMAVQQAVGPVLVTALLADWGRLGWLALALLLAAGTLASRQVGAREIARRLGRPAQTPPLKIPAAGEVHSGRQPIPCANGVQPPRANTTFNPKDRRSEHDGRHEETECAEGA
jgi:hypothetical protein